MTKIATYIHVIMVLLFLIGCEVEEEKKYLRDIYFANHRTSMAVGDTLRLEVKYYPEKTNCGIPDGPMTWTSTNREAISVDGTGLLTALEVGTSTITARIGDFKVSCLITVDYYNVAEDNTFMQFCLENYDTNGDGVLQGKEVGNVVGLDASELSELNIPISFRGIEVFKALRTFKASGLTISELDLSGNKHLTELDVSQSDIARLDLSGNPTIKTVDCHSCPNLVELNFGKSDEAEQNTLNSLNCSRCGLTEIDLSRCGLLFYLDCSHNKLEELDLSQNLLLTQITCNDNNIKSIKVSPEFEQERLKTFETDEGVTLIY